jgi:hypothetical protein
VLPRICRRLLFPVLERSFTYSGYERLLDRLADAERFKVVPLREFSSTQSESQTVVALRHDVDYRLDSALEMARLEQERGLSATYFVLHTAPYWARRDLVPHLLTLQDGHGHEVGWHNDLVTLECVYGGDAREFLSEQLERLRTAGIRIEGSAAHGSPYCYRFGYHNNYFFADFDGEEQPGLPNSQVVETQRGLCRIPKARLGEYGFLYEAYHLDHDLYFSDASFDERGLRWHTDRLDFNAFIAGGRAIILVHPCHWDASAVAKLRRLPAAIERAVNPGRPMGSAE